MAGWLLSAELILVITMLLSSGSIHGKRWRRNSDRECSSIAKSKVIRHGVRDGTVLVELSKYFFSGSPKGFALSEYKYNGNEFSVGDDSDTFSCSSAGFADKRNYICVNENGDLKIRDGSNFAAVPNTTEIYVMVRVTTMSGIVEPCAFRFYVGFEPTIAPLTTIKTTTTTTMAPTTSTAPSTTIGSTSTITKMKSESATTTAAKSTTAVQSTATTIKTTQHKSTTVDPCASTNLFRQYLNRCMPEYSELPRNSTLQIQSSFAYRLNNSLSPKIWKLSHLIVRNYKTILQQGATLKVYLHAVTKGSRIELKQSNMKLGNEHTEMPMELVIPNDATFVVVSLMKKGRLLSVDANMVSLYISTYDFCGNITCLKYYDNWMTNYSKDACARNGNEDPVRQFQTCFDMCQSEKTNMPATNASYVWPLTLAGSTAVLPCENQKGNATRKCSLMQNKPAKWSQVNEKGCKSVGERRSEELGQLSKATFNAANASVASRKVKNITGNEPTSLRASDLEAVTDILEDLSEFAVDEQVANDILDVVDNCMEASYEELREGQNEKNVSRRMLNLLSNVCGALLKNKTSFTMSKKGFALAGTHESKSSFKGLTLTYGSPSAANITSMFSINRNPTNDAGAAMISLPEDLLSSQQKESNDLIFIAYDSGKLFQENGVSRLNSKVISAEVSNASISGLAKPVVTKFKSVNQSTEIESICAWWDFNAFGGKGGWSTSGCELASRGGEYATCHCNHLTNFAVLLGAKAPVENTTNQIILTLISYIGVGISLAGSLFTLISYIIFPKLRDNAPPKILMNLCAALIFLQVAFLAGIEKTNPREGCQAVAFLLHYILLCVLSWSGVEGFFSYRGIVMPMKSEVQNLMFKASMFGWVVPLLFPVIGISIWTGQYGDDQSCAVKGMPLYATVVAPVAAVMLLNIFSIVSIMLALHKSSKMYPHNAINAWHRLRIIAAFVLLFSLTWLFGFFVIANDIIVFQYIFCILNSLQGFFVFIFYGVRNENVRKSWIDKFRVYRERKSTTSTSAGSKKTESSFDSVTYNKTDSLRSDSLKKNGSFDGQFRVHLNSRANDYATSF